MIEKVITEFVEEDKKKKQTESNEDPCTNSIIEMQDLSPTVNDQ